MANSAVVELREMNVARPSAEDLTKALKGASVQRLALELGVPWEDIITLDDFAKKWLESDPNASWERLASALVKIAMDSPPAATALKPTVNPESGNIRIKVVLCGPVSGKTNLVYRFTTGRSLRFTPATFGPEFFRKAVSVSGDTVRLVVWDTGAWLTDLRRWSLSSSEPILLKAHGVVLVYDITRMRSFRDLRDRVKYIQKCVHEETEFVLVGTKKDLEGGREVSRELGETFAEERGFHFFEASATTGENVNELFHCLAEQIVRKKRQSEGDGRIFLSSERQSENIRRSRRFF